MIATQHEAELVAHGHVCRIESNLHAASDHRHLGRRCRGDGIHRHGLRLHQACIAGRIDHARLHGPVAGVAVVVLRTPPVAGHEGGRPGGAAIGRHLQRLARAQSGRQLALQQSPGAAVVGQVVVGVEAAVLADVGDGGGLRRRHRIHGQLEHRSAGALAAAHRRHGGAQAVKPFA
ncbi:hypothetical protein D3C87_1134870 [compost metagenome]